MNSLDIELNAGEEITFDEGRITVRLVKKSGQRARLSVKAKPDVKIERPDSTKLEAVKKGLTIKP